MTLLPAGLGRKGDINCKRQKIKNKQDFPEWFID